MVGLAASGARTMRPSTLLRQVCPCSRGCRLAPLPFPKASVFSLLPLQVLRRTKYLFWALYSGGGVVSDPLFCCLSSPPRRVFFAGAYFLGCGGWWWLWRWTHASSRFFRCSCSRRSSLPTKTPSAASTTFVSDFRNPSSTVSPSFLLSGAPWPWGCWIRVHAMPA